MWVFVFNPLSFHVPLIFIIKSNTETKIYQFQVIMQPLMKILASLDIYYGPLHVLKHSHTYGNYCIGPLYLYYQPPVLYAVSSINQFV